MNHIHDRLWTVALLALTVLTLAALDAAVQSPGAAAQSPGVQATAPGAQATAPGVQATAPGGSGLEDAAEPADGEAAFPADADDGDPAYEADEADEAEAFGDSAEGLEGLPPAWDEDAFLDALESLRDLEDAEGNRPFDGFRAIDPPDLRDAAGGNDAGAPGAGLPPTAAPGSTGDSRPAGSADGTATTATIWRELDWSPDLPTAALGGIDGATQDGLRFNFRGVPLDAVLDYLGRAAGFTIVRDVEVTGRINAWSYQPLDAEAAVNLLNTVLNEMGYAAVRNGSVLRVVALAGARMQNLPVRVGSDPDLIPDTDEMVTQIIPLNFIAAAQLVGNLQALIPSYASLSANESSNSIILTDTQSNIRRVAAIVQALDGSVSNASLLRVFPLQYAKASELANMINNLFQTQAAAGSSSSRRRGPEEFFARMRGDEGQGSSGNGVQARTTGRVTAVADERTNSLVVTAPDGVMPTIQDMVDRIDTVVEDVTVMRVFTLQFADCTEMAALIRNLFQDTTQSSQRQSSRRQRYFGSAGDREQADAASTGEISVTAVADTRTNSVVVSGPNKTVEEIGKMVVELDLNPAKQKKVFVHSLENADVDNVAEILRGMFDESGARNTGANANSGAFSGLRNTQSNQSSQNRQTRQTR